MDKVRSIKSCVAEKKSDDLLDIDPDECIARALEVVNLNFLKLVIELETLVIEESSLKKSISDVLMFR